MNHQDKVYLKVPALPAVLLTLIGIIFTLYLWRKPRPNQSYLKTADSVTKIKVDSTFTAQPIGPVNLPETLTLSDPPHKKTGLLLRPLNHMIVEIALILFHRK
jgi:hypothetical protein